MRASVAVVLTVLSTTLAAAAKDSVRGVLDLEFRVIDLSHRVLDLAMITKELEGEPTQLAMQENATEIRIELSADVLFDFDKSDIKPEAEAKLNELAAVLKAYPDQPVKIEGHTDSKGSDDYNQALSEKRALAVRGWLARRTGPGASGFEAIGFGESRPASPDTRADGSDDPEARQKNRRVEIVISKRN